MYRKHFEDAYPNEAVGYIWEGEFYPLESESTHPDKYGISPKDLFMLYQLHYQSPVELIHSHIDGDNKPSELDITAQKGTTFRMSIVSVRDGVCSDKLIFGEYDEET
ncbi:TPA: Mov34/MPN/PAD-1 family protein [Photobacterium damselae]